MLNILGFILESSVLILAQFVNVNSNSVRDARCARAYAKCNKEKKKSRRVRGEKESTFFASFFTFKNEWFCGKFEFKNVAKFCVKFKFKNNAIWYGNEWTFNHKV